MKRQSLNTKSRLIPIISISVLVFHQVVLPMVWLGEMCESNVSLVTVAVHFRSWPLSHSFSLQEKTALAALRTQHLRFISGPRPHPPARGPRETGPFRYPCWVRESGLPWSWTSRVEPVSRVDEYLVQSLFSICRIGKITLNQEKQII